MSTGAELRHHINVVRENRKITNAMYLISSAKMKRAVKMQAQNHEYFTRVRSNIRYILEGSHGVHHMFLTPRPGGRTVYLVIAADKGLCGGYNHKVLSTALEHMGSREVIYTFTIGHMASEFFEKNRKMPDSEFQQIIQNPSLEDARAITESLTQMYRNNMFDELFVAFTEMESLMVQTPRVVRMLPMLEEDFENAPRLAAPQNFLLHHPSPSVLLDALVPQYLIGYIYGTLVQSFASEQRARMTAMDASTRNADEMLARLNIEHNRIRQAAITQEITEIITDAAALSQL